MAIETIDLDVKPEEEWVLVATNPTNLTIKPAVLSPWFLAIVESGEPDHNLKGLPFGVDHELRGDAFEAGAIAGLVYVRTQQPIRFGILRDQ